MHRTATMVVLGLALACAATGCQSHKAKVADIQKQYDQLGAQYRKDCFAEVTEMVPSPTPKCTAEKRKLDDAWIRLQAAHTKK